MAERSVSLRIQDMLDAIAFLEKEVLGQSFEVYESKWLMRLATERAVEIISEASRHIPQHMKTHYPDVRWKSIAGIGNVLRHDYAGVQSAIIWKAITDDIAHLKSALSHMARSDIR